LIGCHFSIFFSYSFGEDTTVTSTFSAWQISFAKFY
jgi:hypothetical protein